MASLKPPLVLTAPSSRRYHLAELSPSPQKQVLEEKHSALWRHAAVWDWSRSQAGFSRFSRRYPAVFRPPPYRSRIRLRPNEAGTIRWSLMFTLIGVDVW